MATKEEIKGHLNHILAEVAQVKKIKNCELKSEINTNNADGFIAQFFTGSIQNKDTGETSSVAIKKTQFDNSDYNVLFNNEYVFYDTAFPVLDRFQQDKKVSQPFTSVPNYYCGNTKEPNKEFIAMEYLKPDGYVMHDKTKFFDQEHLINVFQTYAKFHALSYVLRKKHPETYQKIIKDMVNAGPSLLEFEDRLVVSTMSAAVAALDAEKYKDMYEDLQAFEQNTVKNFLRGFEYNGEHRCLAHGDGWSNNMLFKYSDSGKLLDMKLLDFQLCRDGTPIHDLSYSFYSSGSKKDFDNIEFFLQVYYKTFSEFALELGANLSDIFSYEVLVNEWKENALIGVIFGIWLWQLKGENKEDFNEFLKGKNPQSDQERRRLWNEYLKTLCNTTTFKENSNAILSHALEYGIIRKDKILID